MDAIASDDSTHGFGTANMVTNGYFISPPLSTVRSIIALAALFSTAGCADSGAGDPGWSIDDDAGFSQDDESFGQDTGLVGSDSIDSPDTVDCRPQVTSTGFIDGADRPVVMDGSIYFEKETDEGLELFVRELQASQTRQLTDEDEPVSLLAGANGRLLTWNIRSDSEDRFARFDVRNPAGDVLTTIYDSRNFLSSYPVVTFTGEPRGFFDGERFVGTAGGRDLLMYDSEGEFVPPEIHTDGRHNWVSTVALTTSGFVYVGAPVKFEDHSEYEPGDIFVWEPRVGHARLTTTDENERYIWADGRFVYWVSELGVYRYEFGSDAAPVRIHHGRCGPPHANGQRVVYACEDAGNDAAPEESDTSVPIPRATQLFLVDGSESHRIELDGERALIHSLRLSQSGILWVEFDAMEAICTGEGLGRVMYYHLDSEQLFQVGEIQPPAWCDFYYLQINLSVDNGVISWNRAPSPASAAQTGVGYATVDRPPRCR